MHPDPVLREPATAVTTIDDSVRRLARDMAETMYAAPGIGLAAPQVGVQRRVFVYRLSEEEELRTLVNPEIVSSSGEVTEDEGCLSIPGLTYPVTRAQRVSVKALDLEGNAVAYDAEDMEARVIQHEVDHLDGVLFIDRIDDVLRREARRILRERALGGTAAPAQRTSASNEVQSRAVAARSTQNPGARI
jgi:peptide deformylase